VQNHGRHPISSLGACKMQGRCQTEPSETRNPLKDKPGTPEIKTGADTRTGRSRRQKGWKYPCGQTSLTSPSQRRS
ncbi:unnamed protein product, partial [Brassica rapa]